MAPPSITNVLTTVANLNATNWTKFGKGFRIFLLRLDALWVVDGHGDGVTPSADQRTLDCMLVPYLYSKVIGEFQYLVEDATSASAAWTALKDHFEKSNMTNRFFAHGELHAIIHDPSKEISVYIRAFSDLILLNFHPSFHGVCTIRLARTTEPSLEEIMNLLTAYPGIKQESNEISGLACAVHTPST
ncbi:hypothetical protein FB45DRAFT_1047003 [Roridomyces roridus]|uniref:Uncharacterized protein n=1 Tax=Roridomyces roridus TaxID=1738132 RepID=A0AAD7AWV5_9AGAR|nr:hypothetical protein FB45DRAFT_1047003 [Roridomyces roridus]